MPIKRVDVVVGRDANIRVDQLNKLLSSAGIESRTVSISDIKDVSSADAVIVIGADSDVLRTIHAMDSSVVPVLPISPPGYSTFFASIDWEEIKEGIKKLASGRYVIHNYVRIRALVDGAEVLYALNEIAVFPARSATLV
ncbi:MAG: NAD(+)/NADH kinase, partial [Desulfurococcales archaeon]|nr:NAD(+)/NADH kinase [Desulfurococcales archaeon]